MSDTTVLYHWILTLQTADGRIATQDGTLPVRPGVDTRESALAAVHQAVQGHYHLEDVPTTTLFFSLERNELEQA